MTSDCRFVKVASRFLVAAAAAFSPSVAFPLTLLHPVFLEASAVATVLFPALPAPVTVLQIRMAIILDTSLLH